MTHRIILLLTIALFMGTIVLGQTGNVVEKGQPVPNFSFTSAEGQTLDISDYKGKVMLINFFATWCGPCMAEMPVIQEKVWTKYKDNSKFAMLAFGRGHTAEEVKAFKESKQFGFPIYPDANKSIYAKFATQYIPRNYIIDTNGHVVYSSVGYSAEEFDVLLQTLAQLLK
jgi:peroxiredoxin